MYCLHHYLCLCSKQLVCLSFFLRQFVSWTFSSSYLKCLSSVQVERVFLKFFWLHASFIVFFCCLWLSLENRLNLEQSLWLRWCLPDPVLYQTLFSSLPSSCFLALSPLRCWLSLTVLKGQAWCSYPQRSRCQSCKCSLYLSSAFDTRCSPWSECNGPLGIWLDLTCNWNPFG